MVKTQIMSSIRVAQFGCGYWGPHLMRNLFAHPAVEVAGLVDTNDQVRDWLVGHYPEVPFTTNTALEQLEKLIDRDLIPWKEIRS